MAINQKIFRETLYTEHLEEAAFKYETRLAWLKDKEVGWQDLEDIDAALEAHIDALMVGEKQALAVCFDHLANADASILHVIVCVLCRHRLITNFEKFWENFDFDDNEKVSAVSDAFKWECPQEWLPRLIKVFSDNNPKMFPVLAASVAQHAPDSGQCLLQGLSETKHKDVCEMLIAISRCNRNIIQQACIREITPYLGQAEPDIVEQAAKTLLIMGDSGVLPKLQNAIQTYPYIFALGGGVAESHLLLQFAKNNTANGDILIAIGLLGDLASIPCLLGYLQHPNYAPMAAQALQLISGASIYENVHETDEVEENELFEHEIEDFKKGELPKNIDGNPFGADVSQLSTNPITWDNWFKSNKNRFIHGLRFRNGKTFSPTELLNNLVDNQTPTTIRQFAYHELVIRYRLEVPFAVDNRVNKQQSELNQIQAWISRNQQVFINGKWYFDGGCLDRV